MTKKRFSQRMLSMFLALVMLLSYLPLSVFAANSLSRALVVGTFTDPGTADSWEHMMGTDSDGNRYAGRMWVDKSVYKDGDVANLGGGNSFRVALEEDENFQIVFSALGSTMTTTETVTSTGPMDVVLVLDTSTSMDDEDASGTTRLERTITAANGLLDDLATLRDVRIAIVTYNRDSETVIPLAKYANGVRLAVTDYYNNGSSDAGVVTAYDNNGGFLGRDSGYTMGTNLQSGIDRGFNILANATGAEGRVPVAIVLTDGQANRASQEGFYELSSHSDTDGTGASGRNLYLSTLLNAAYTKTKIEENYKKDAIVYSVGVDITDNVVARLLMNPADSTNGFNARNADRDVRRAYESFESWKAGQNVSYNGWTFDHNYPKQNGAITDAKIAANINYADTYFDVSGVNLEDAFQQIYEELSSGVFNPISSSTTSSGGTGEDTYPLIYVDFIGKYMEVKEIQTITLFGSSYGVIKNEDGTYSVDEGQGYNPTTGELWSTSGDIKITVKDQTDGTQKLQVEIDREILPILLEQVVSETVGDKTTATITEIPQAPLRVFYTVGISSEILLPNGEIDVSKIQGYPSENGTVSFYSNRYGVMNPPEGGIVVKGDAHAGFKPSKENRYYYHQTSQGIFTKITDKASGSTVTIPENEEYGIVWDENKYDLNWMTYDEYKAAKDTDKVYTYVTYYHPTPSATDAKTAAEEVTYLVYNDWKYMKESIAFYDATSETYLNGGKVIEISQVESTVNAYKTLNPGAEIYAVLGVESLRTSRLHNMVVSKGAVGNVTGTAENSFVPEYTHETASIHNGNDVVVWLGNNGKVTVKIDTGIALTKRVTEPIGGADDTYTMTVTVPASVVANPGVVNENGEAVPFTFVNNVISVSLKAGQTVYIDGIPEGTECLIGEEIPAGAPYYVESKTDRVTIPKVADVLNGGTPQFVSAIVTNAPYKYGDLTVIKDIDHDFDTIPAAMADKVFTFKVQLPAELVGETYQVDKANASLFTGTEVVVVQDGSYGSFEVALKENESITILDLPAGTSYTVTETSNVEGYVNDPAGPIQGTILPDGDHDAHFVNVYENTPVKPDVTVSGTKTVDDINGTYALDEEFIFVLSKYVPGANGAVGTYAPLAEQKAKDGEGYTFQLKNLLPDPLGIGEHYFQVTEKSGNTIGMSYDSTRGLFVVKVTDTDANGILEYTAENVGNTAVSGNTVTKNFTNTYDVQRTHADINIEKTLVNDTGVNLPLNLFHFELVNISNPDGATLPARTVTTDATGKATIRLTELGVGTYTYTLTEKNEGLAGMQYDTAPRSVTVTVSESGGVLTPSVQIDGADTNTALFRNTYALTSTSYTIRGEKVLFGRAIRDDEFEFQLFETDSSFALSSSAVPKETVKNLGKSFAFGKITYDKAGTYYYSVKEKNLGAAGMQYDTIHYHVIVEVGVNGTALEVKSVVVNKIGHNSDTSGNIVFENRYRAASTEHVLSGTKILHGRTVKADEFSFELYNVTGGTRNKIETVLNKTDGTFRFAPLTFTAEGTYLYSVEETLPASGQAAGGVDYYGTTRPITVKIRVVDENAQLKVSSVTLEDASGNPIQGGIRFENFYQARKATVRFNGTKELKGEITENKKFDFRIYETDNTFDITTGTEAQTKKSVTVTPQSASDSFFFEQNFFFAGVYYFVIAEDVSDPIEGIVYDREHHRFIVRVTDIGDGQLRSVVTNVDTGATTSSDAQVSVDTLFENATFEEVAKKEVFKAEDTTVQIDGKKVRKGEEITYFITYNNFTGENVLVDIMDTIPEYTSYVSGTASHGGTYLGTHLSWILNVAKDESVTVSFTVKVDKTQAIVANTAVILDGVNTYHTNEVVNHTVEEPLEKEVFASEDPTVSIDGKKVYKGDELLYKITFINAEGKEVDVKITDVIPAGTTYVEGSADRDGVYADGKIVWDLKDVPAWSKISVSFKVRVNENVGAATIRNQATASGTNDYESTVVTNYTVEDEVEKKVFKENDLQTNIDGNKVKAGDILVYTIRYKNTAKDEAYVTITDTVPQNTEYVEGSLTGRGTHQNGLLIWTLLVGAGEEVTVSFKVKVLSENVPVKNKANVSEGKNYLTTNEVVTPFEAPEIPAGPQNPTAPQTGDMANLQLWFALLFVSSGGLITTTLYERKRRENQAR